MCRGRRPAAEPKWLWLKPLRKDWQRCLRAKPAFGRANFADGRLRKRLVRIAETWLQRADQPIPEMFPARAAQRAVYRFLHNGRVSFEGLCEPHAEALLERMQGLREVLLVQDTTSVNLDSSRRVIQGLVRIGDHPGRQTQGLWVHACVAYTPGGFPLGVAALRVWTRSLHQTRAEFDGKESVRWVEGFDLACELGRLCPGTRDLGVRPGERQLGAVPAAGGAVGSGRFAGARQPRSPAPGPRRGGVRGLGPRPVAADRDAGADGDRAPADDRRPRRSGYW